MPPGQLLDHPLDRRRTVLDLPRKPALVRRTSLSNRHRVLQLCCIKADKYLAMLSHGLFLRA
jgi:hypothetical protein